MVRIGVVPTPVEPNLRLNGVVLRRPELTSAPHQSAKPARRVPIYSRYCDFPRAIALRYDQFGKVRDLIRKLESAGWVLRSMRGSHRQFKHPQRPSVVTVAGHPGKFHYPQVGPAHSKLWRLRGAGASGEPCRHVVTDDARSRLHRLFRSNLGVPLDGTVLIHPGPTQLHRVQK